MPQKQLTSRALAERLPRWGVAALESHHAPDFTMEWRTHPFIKLMYAVSGEGELHIGNKNWAYRKGDLLTVPAGKRNRLIDRPSQPVSIYLVCVSRDLLAFDRRVETQLRAGCTTLDMQFANRADAVFRQLMFLQSGHQDSRSLPMVAGALELVRIAIESVAQPDTRRRHERDEDLVMQQYVQRLDKTFFEPTTLDEAACSLGISRRSFSQRFRAATGQSWLAYRQSKAIGHACRLLAETQTPITSVAFECGFGDLSSFYRTFKASTGESPGAWRKTVRVVQDA